jgi:hypothetical protein
VPSETFDETPGSPARTLAVIAASVGDRANGVRVCGKT